MPKLILPENIAKLKEQLDTENNLVDYFFICGIPPSLCTNELLYKVSSSEKNSEELKEFFGNFQDKQTLKVSYPGKLSIKDIDKKLYKIFQFK